MFEFSVSDMEDVDSTEFMLVSTTLSLHVWGLSRYSEFRADHGKLKHSYNWICSLSP